MRTQLNVFALLALLPLRGIAQDTSFILETQLPHPYIATSIGNGLFSVTTSSTSLSAAGSFASGVYDHTPGDVPRIAVLPAWNAIEVYDGDTWLQDVSPGASMLNSYRQRLDMYNGIVTTSYSWMDGKRITDINVETFVSRPNAHLAVVSVTITPQFDGRLMLRFPLSAWSPPRRMNLALLDKLEPGANGRMPSQWDVWYPGYMRVKSSGSDAKSGLVWLTAGVAGDSVEVGEASVVSMPRALRHPLISYSTGDTLAELNVAFDGEKGRQYIFSKFVSVVSSRESPAPVRAARQTALKAFARGYAKSRTENANAWHSLWSTDIVLEGNLSIQKAVHAMIFYLLCSVREGTAYSIPPMGLTTPGYYGHVFWDADTYIIPTLALMHPTLARSMVMFRSRTLGAARQNASMNGYAGAMYPWEADERGDETTPRFAAQNATHEIHISGDVAHAQWLYYLATGDLQWLVKYGYPVIRETAAYWSSRVTRNSEHDRYDVRDVVSVDEGLMGINNDAYTNAVAKANLECAVRASSLAGRKPDSRWDSIASKMYIPYDAARAIHPTYEHAPDSTFGSVVTLLDYPLGVTMPQEARRNDLDHAARRFLAEGGGAMMVETFYPVIAAEVRDTSLFQLLVPKTFEPHLRGPFLVLAETPTNDAVNFLTGAGGFLQQVIYGYTGVRLGPGGLMQAYPPLLPHGVKKLTLKNFTARGRQFTIVVDDSGLRRIDQ